MPSYCPDEVSNKLHCFGLNQTTQKVLLSTHPDNRMDEPSYVLAWYTQMTAIFNSGKTMFGDLIAEELCPVRVYSL